WRLPTSSLFPYTTLFRSVLDEAPDILLFDEPTFGQDAATTAELMDYVMGVKAKGTAIIFVTHDMNIVDAADCVVVLKQGKVAFSDRKSTRLNSSHVSISY